MRIIGSILLFCLGAVAVHAEGTRTNGNAQILIPGDKDKSIAYNRYHYAPAVKVGNVIYASGVAVTAEGGDLEAAFHRCWQRIAQVLAEGGASLDDIVEFTSYHTDPSGQLAPFTTVKDHYIKAPYPAWTLIGVSQLAFPDFVVEVKVTAVLSK